MSIYVQITNVLRIDLAIIVAIKVKSFACIIKLVILPDPNITLPTTSGLCFAKGCKARFSNCYKSKVLPIYFLQRWSIYKLSAVV